MPDFEFLKSDRFAGDFLFSPDAGHQVTPAEDAYVKRLRIVMDRLAAADMSQRELLNDLEHVRTECAENLLHRARRFAAMPAGRDRDLAAEREVEASHRAEGVYQDRRARVLEIPFVVSTVTEGRDNFVCDIQISVRDAPISDDKRRFKIEIDRSITVIRTVLGERRSAWSWAKRRRGPDPMVEDARRRMHEYLMALSGVAKVGLMNLDKTQTPFATLALEGLQGEFVAREAGIVKNAYVTRLGVAALIAVVLGVMAYVGSGMLPKDWIPHRFREFFLLACGASVGTWLSFSLRRVQLTFADLATLEEDRLNPSLRIVFMVALTMTVGLLLWTHAVVIEIGGFKSSFQNNGAFAVLIGVMSGIAERAMTTAVSKRAQDFAASLGGGKP